MLELLYCNALYELRLDAARDWVVQTAAAEYVSACSSFQ